MLATPGVMAVSSIRPTFCVNQTVVFGQQPCLTSTPRFLPVVRFAVVAQGHRVVAFMTFTAATANERPDPRSMIDRHDGAAPTPFGLRREFDFIEIDNVDLRHGLGILWHD